MAIHTLHRTAVLHTTPVKAWEFFSDPGNLARITPPELGFQVVSEVPKHIYAGLMIEYRVRPLLGIPLKWLTEITQVRKGEYFVDEQRHGPYALWHHEHWFRTLSDGLVEMEDRVTYTPPFGPLGTMVHPWLIRPQLERIFAHRENVMAEVFTPGDP